jgi:serine/threonine protein kinase
VFLVRDKNSGKLYAMKTLSKRKILGQNLVRYAKTERDVLSYMRHPFIVNLHYAFQSKTKLFLILEFCPGGDLGKIIAHERRFTEDRARLYIAEVLLALHDLHKRDIIYRDLKPDNVVLDDDGHALLTDFGLSKEGVLEVSKGAKSFCGSIAYLAPEMLRRVGHGKSVDWYLLGVLLYEMLVGTPPYFSGNKDELFNNIMNGPLKLPRSISTEAKNLMVSLLNRNPTKRLGAGPEGALEIQRHPFFASVNWADVLAKRTRPPKPRLRTEHFNKQYPYSEFSRKQIQDIFDDEKEINQDTKDNVGTQNVDGWSFVKQTESHLEIFEQMKKD